MSIHRRALARVFSSRRFHGIDSRLQQHRSRRKKRRELQLETLEPRAMLSANAPPENTVPSDIQDAIINQPFAFTAYRGNQISISDTDAAGNLEVTLAVNQGFLTLINPDPGGALQYSEGNGTEDATMVFQGTVDAINTALSWVAFVGDSTGPATLTITTDDSPHMNAEGESDTDTIQISVGAVPAFTPTPTHATYPSALDPEIGAGLGWVIRNPVGTVNRINDMKLMPDGTFVAVGAINDTFAIFRVLENLNLDEGGFGTQVTDLALGTHAQRFVIDSEGRFLAIGGDKIVRFTASGKLDESFGNEGIVTWSELSTWTDTVSNDHRLITDIQILPNGNFAVTGRQLRERGGGYWGNNLLVNEYDSSGVKVRSFDPSTQRIGYNSRFDLGSNHPSWLPDIIDIRDDGDFLLASHGDSFDVVRTSRGGTQEKRYDVPLPGTEYHRSSLALPDGKFLLIGRTDNDVVVTRHLPSGAHDTTFGTDGITKVPVLSAADEGYRATLAQDGKILITGHANNGKNNDIFVIRLHHDGTLDETFDTDGIMSVNIGSDDRGHAIVVTADNKIVIAGRSGNKIALVRLLGDSDQSSLPPNQAPINSVPGAQTVTIDQPHAFTEYRGNLISISDADAGNNHVQVTLEVTNGTVTLANNRDPRGGITYIEGDGFEDVTVTFSGTITDINEALEWVSYQPPTEYLGNDTLTITTTDNGHVGSGGSLSDIDTIAITVSAVEDFATTPSFHTEPSALDSTFGNNGIQLIEQSAGTDFIHSMRVLETSDANNGKVIAVGAINNMFGVMRFNADMTLDESFGQNGGGFTQTDLGGNTAREFAIDSEGRILVVGGDKIARFTASGQLDESFGSEGSVTWSELSTWTDTVSNDHRLITDIQILPNGNFAVTGRQLRERGGGYWGNNLLVNEYDSSGVKVRSFDPSTQRIGYNSRFDLGSNHPSWLPDIIDIRDDGDFLLASHGDSFDVVRTSRGGTQEKRYDVPLPGTEYHRSSLALPDGKFLLIGRTDNDVVVTRHLPSGAHDTTFGTDGITKVPVLSAADEGYRATLAQDGKILITGHANNGKNNDIFVIRLHHDGTLDETFDTDGIMSVNIGSDDRGHAIVVTADNKIVIAGRSGNKIALVRLLGDSDQSSLPPNQAPINSVPGAQTVTIDQPHAFTEYRGNLISISDADAGNNHVQVTLEVTNGTVTLANNRDPRGGITYIEGDGFEDVTVTFSGTITDINEALEWVSYRNSPSTRYMQWEAADGGNDHWYEFVPTTKTWAEAKTDAEARGGYLATVTSTPESEFINDFLYEISGATPWLGGYQVKDGTFFTEPDRGWNWVTDEPFTYLNWKTGEPNDTNQASNQDYLQHQNIDNDGKWADANGSEKHGYFVEYESDPREAPITGDTLTITTNDLGSIGLGEPRTDVDTIELTINPPEAFPPSPGYTTTPAALDPTFDQDGRQILSVTNSIDLIHSMRVLETSDANNGKVIAVGAINNMFGVMRFNADMTLDESFGQNGGGFTQTDLGGNTAREFAIDSEGRILVVGGDKIARFTASGQLDESFGSEGSVTWSELSTWTDTVSNDHRLITDIQILPNGNFAVTGRQLRERGGGYWGNNLLVNEYDSSGVKVRSFDPSTQRIGYNSRFDLGSNHPSWLPDIIDIRDDGDFLLASHGDSFDVVRTSRGGTQEKRYDVPLPGTEYHRSSLALPDGKFLLIGRTDNDVVVTRHLPSGKLDLNFGTTEGKTVFPVLSAADEGYRATLAQDGKILITGHANNGENNDIFVARLTPEGLLDDTFGTGGTTTINMNLTLPVNDYGYAIVSVPEGEHRGKIVIAGRTGDDIALIRLMGDFDDRQPPSNITLTNLNVDENSEIGTIVGTFNTIDDNAPILSTYSLIPGAGSTHNDLFVIDGSTLTVNGPIDYETDDTLSIRVRSVTSDGRSLDKAFTITVNDINEAPVAITLTDVTEWILESENTTERIRLATMVIDDDALGIETISITGDDATDFETDGDGLFLKAGTKLDFEAKNLYQITINAVDDSLLESVPVTVDYTLDVYDTNRPPSDLILTPDTISLPEDTDTSTAIDLAAITFDDDTTGTNTLSLTGDYADMFEIGGNGTDGYRLLLKASDSIHEFPDSVLPGTTLDNLPSDYEMSGLTWHSGLQKLFAVSDEGIVSMMNADGTERVNWNVPGDLEALTVADHTSTKIYIGVEHPDSILEFDVSTGQVTRTFELTNWMTGEDSKGLEALAFVPDATHPEGGIFYAGLQDDGRIYQFSLPVTSSSSSTAVNFLQSISIEGGSTDLAGLAYEPSSGQLLALFDSIDQLNVIDPDGQLRSRWTVPGAGQEAVVFINGNLYIGDDTLFSITQYTNFDALIDTSGVLLDFETEPTLTVTVAVADETVLNSSPATAVFTIDVTDVNEAPTAIELAIPSGSLPQQQTPTSSPTILTKIAVIDDALGTNMLTIGGPDAEFFEITDGSSFQPDYLALKQGTVLDHATKDTFTITLTATDESLPESTPVTINYQLQVEWTNDAPTDVILTNTVTSLPENTLTEPAIRLADIGVTDDGYGDYETSLSGPDAQHFFIDGTSLYLQAGTSLNFEEKASYQVTVVASDTASLSESTSAQAAFTLSIVDVNEPPTQINVTPPAAVLPELLWNDVTKYPIKVADVSVSDDALGTHPVTLSGPDADAFELAEGYFYPPGLYLKAGTALDFEVKPTLSVVLTTQDPALPDAAPVEATFSLTLENVNEPPFDLRLTEVIDTIPEDSDTTGPIRLAKVSFIDDGTGVHTISLAGTDANAFQVINQELFLKAGTPLDFNQKSSYSVTVSVDDDGIPDFTPLSVAYELQIENVNFRPALDTTPTQALTGIPAGVAPTPGSTQGSILVSDLLKKQDSASTFTDRDADAPGIAIVKTHLEGGSLWYSTNNGTNWYDVGEVSGTNARLLFADSMTRIAYQPAPEVHQTLEAAFSFKAWDRTGGFANGHAGINTMVRFGDATTGAIDTPGFAHTVALAPHGRTAFVGDREQGVHVINLLDRQQPEMLSTFQTTGAVFDVVTAPEGLVLVANGQEGLSLLEVTSGHTLQEISRLATEGTAQAIVLSADAQTAFVANGTDGVLVVDITDSANPQLVRRINTLGNANDIALSANGNTMFVANGESGVRVFDITDPLLPRTLDIVETNAQAKSIVLSPDDRFAAVANGSGGLVLFNTENPASLSQLSRIELAGTAKAVTLNSTGRLAYVTGSRAGLHIVDISKRRQPLRIHTIDTPGYASDVTLTKDGHHALVADWNEGLRVLHVRPPSSFSTEIETVSAAVTPQAASIQLIRVVNTLPESTSTAGRIRVADILVTPSTDERYELTLTGPDTANFEILDTGLYLRPGTRLDFETQSRLEIAVQATTPGNDPLVTPYILELTDANEPPFALRLVNTVPALADSEDTSVPIRIADIAFEDDALGSATLSLGGVDATIFEIRDAEQGKSLFLRAGTTLNAEIRPRLQVVVKVADPTLPFAPEKVEWAVQIGADQPPPPPETPATISGRVKYAMHETPLAGVSVQLNTNDPASSPTLVGSFVTTTNGLFSFQADRGNDYELTVTKSGNVQSLTAHDAAFVLQHLAEQTRLNEMQVLSADYDGSGHIDALDAGLILQDSLGTSPVTNGSEASDWIFRPRTFSYENLTQDAVAQNFVGILRGDVTANWSTPPSAPTTQPVHVQLSSPDLAFGFTGKMSLSIAGGTADVFSANITIEYDPAVLRITPGDIQPATSDGKLMVAARNPQEGRIVVAIASPTPLPREVPLLSIAATSLLETAGSPIAVTAASLNEGSIPAVLGSSNAKTLTPIDENGDVRLGKGRDGRIYANGKPLRINGAEVKNKVFEQFDLLEAETVNGKNIAHVRRNNGKTYRWNLSEDWEFAGIETIGNLDTVALPRASRGPEFVIPERTVIEDHGDIELTKDNQGHIYANGNQIYLGSQPFSLTQFEAFTPLAAEVVSGGNRILFSTAAGIFEQAYDRHWRSVGLVNTPQPVSELSPTQIGTIETTYGVDVDGNNLIGMPSPVPGTIIEANGSITLSYTIQELDGVVDPGMIVDRQILVYANEHQILPRMDFGLPQSLWLVQPVAAETIDGVNKLLVRASRDNQQSVIIEWTVSNDWASPVTTKVLTGQEVLEAEANYEVSLGDSES